MSSPQQSVFLLSNGNGHSKLLWCPEIGVDSIGKRLVNSKEGPPTFKQTKRTLQKLLEYGSVLVQEEENVKRVQLADKYLRQPLVMQMKMPSRMEVSMVRSVILRDLMRGKAAQQVNIPVREGCTDPSAENYDPTARRDDGSCLYQF